MYLEYTVSQPQSKKSVALSVIHVRAKGSPAYDGQSLSATDKAATTSGQRPSATNTAMSLA